MHVLLTYGGLKRFVRSNLGKLGDETDVELRRHLERGLAKGAINSIENQLSDARKLGLKLYACSSAMAHLNISRAELHEEIDEVVGLATFLNLAREATIHWYI